jgi:hypothetical protein
MAVKNEMSDMINIAIAGIFESEKRCIDLSKKDLTFSFDLCVCVHELASRPRRKVSWVMSGCIRRKGPEAMMLLFVVARL